MVESFDEVIIALGTKPALEGALEQMLRCFAERQISPDQIGAIGFADDAMFDYWFRQTIRKYE